MKKMAGSRQEVSDLLRSCGINLTHQRIEIAMVLFAQRQHLSADQILAAVNARHTEVSKATVYNTLRLFLEKGLISEVIVDPTRIFYDTETSAHYHLYDVASGELTDIAAEGVQVIGLPPLPAGTRADRIDIIVRTRPDT